WLAALAAAAPATPAAATAPAASRPFAFISGFPSLGLFFFVFSFRLLDFGLLVLFLHRSGRSPGRCHRPRAGALDGHPRAFEALVDDDLDEDTVALFNIGKLCALLVEHIDRRFPARTKANPFAAAARRLVLEDAQRRQACRGCRPHEACAFAMGTGLGRCLEHAGAQALPAHLHQAEARNPADLDARAVVLERVLHRLLDLPDMARLLHVDE